MFNSTNTGAAILGLAKLRNANRDADDAVNAHNNVVDNFTDYIFRAKSRVHGYRALVHAKDIAENQLIAALKAENANHPLASKEAIEAAIEDERIKALLNPEVIKETYPDGKLPKGAVGGDPLGVRSID